VVGMQCVKGYLGINVVQQVKQEETKPETQGFDSRV